MNTQKMTIEVLEKITNNITQVSKGSTNITKGYARVSNKQMMWLSKVWFKETGLSLLFNRPTCFSITSENFEYSIPDSPSDKWGNYIITIFPKTVNSLKSLADRAKYVDSDIWS